MSYCIIRYAITNSECFPRYSCLPDSATCKVLESLQLHRLQSVFSSIIVRR